MKKTLLFSIVLLSLTSCNDSPPNTNQPIFPPNYNDKSHYNLKGPVKKLITHRFVDSDVRPEHTVEVLFSKDGYQTQKTQTYFAASDSTEIAAQFEETFEYDKKHRVIGGFAYDPNIDSNDKNTKKYYYENDQVLYPNKIEFVSNGKVNDNMTFKYDFDKKTVSDTWTSQKQKVTYETFSRYDKNNHLVEMKAIFNSGTAEASGSLMLRTYNDDGLMISESRQNIPFEPNMGSFSTYEYVEFDDYGNWTKAIVTSSATRNGKPFEHKRTIEYYR